MRGGRGERLAMTRILGTLLISILVLSSNGAYLSVAAEDNEDPVHSLAGGWAVPGAVTTVTIYDNHIVQHSRLGQGDITHDNADYYHIRYRERSMTCHYVVRIPSATELSMLREDNQELPECDLGDLRRVRYTEGVPGGVTEIWAQIKDSEDPKIFETFRHQFGSKYPDYDAKAKKRLAELTPSSGGHGTTPEGPATSDKGPSTGDVISDIIKGSDNQGRSLSITPESSVYHVGDVANFTVVSSQGCYLTLLSQDDRAREATVIFPNKYQQINWIPGNTPVTVPGTDAPFVFRLKDRGTETVVAVCTDKNVPADGIIHDFSRSEFTSVPDYARVVSRGIEVQRKSAETYQHSSSFQPAQANIWRAVIKVPVR